MAVVRPRVNAPSLGRGLLSSFARFTGFQHSAGSRSLATIREVQSLASGQYRMP